MTEKVAMRVGRFLPACLLLAAAGCGMTAPKTVSVETTAPVADSSYVPAGYVRVFGDEFNGAALDTGKWWTRYIYNNGMLDTLNDEQQRYRENNNHVMTGTSLCLVARRKDGEKQPRFRFESGMVRSKTTFKYGYYETRAKVPGALGVWPAFWLNSDATAEGKTTWPPEIDIFEFVNNGKDDRPDMLHIGAIVRGEKGKPNAWGGSQVYAAPEFKGKGSGGYYYAPFRFPDAFHVYALLWDTDDTVTWFVDGKKLLTVHYKWAQANGKDAPYAHVLLNLGIGGKWAGRYGVDEAAFPQSFEIDYVRVYQKRDHVLTGEGRIGRDLMPVPGETKKEPAAAPAAAPKAP